MVPTSAPSLAWSQRQRWRWPYWYLVPIYPYGQRRTLRQTLVADWLWSFEQLQGIFYVVVPIRMTVVRLATGGLWIYAPVAPTPECLTLLGELVEKYGPVKYIVQPTLSGLEHKVFVAPLARHCPQAQIYLAPGQWSFPLNLPLSWLGFPPHRTHFLPADASQAPFAQEFDYQILGPLDLRLGQFGEVAFFHRPTQSLLLTDLLVSLPATPPPITVLDPYPLLFHARDNAQEELQDTPANRQRGWQRVCLFALYFQPSSLDIAPWPRVWQEAGRVSQRRGQNYFGLYPFQWQWNWQNSFEQLRGEGRPFVAPILRQLILNRHPQQVLRWVDKISLWPIKQIISAHFDAPIPLNSCQFHQCFAFLEQELGPEAFPLPQADLKSLEAIDRILVFSRLVPPPHKSN